MRATIKIAILVLAIALAAGFYVRTFHPIHWIFLMNQAHYYLGLSDSNYWKLFAAKKVTEEGDGIAWFDSRFREVTFRGYCDSVQCWQLGAQLLEFHDSKIGIAYSPLLRQGHLFYPNLTISIPGQKWLSCQAQVGHFDPTDMTILLREGLTCASSNSDSLVSKVELNPSGKFAHIQYWSGQERWEWR